MTSLPKPRNMTTKTPSVPNIQGSRNSFTRSYLFGPRQFTARPQDEECFNFIIPPEAPVFYPSEEEFQDPLSFINKIRPIAETTGICKIKPPSNWQPPFTVDVDKLRFTPRIQRLNELEAKTRIKLNFLDQIAKFWELQGSSLKIPMLERKALDLYTLHRLVQIEGGANLVSRDRKWARIALSMGYQPGRGIGSLLKLHYDKLLYPYDVFIEEKKIKIEKEAKIIVKAEKEDKEVRPAKRSFVTAQLERQRRRYEITVEGLKARHSARIKTEKIHDSDSESLSDVNEHAARDVKTLDENMDTDVAGLPGCDNDDVQFKGVKLYEPGPKRSRRKVKRKCIKKEPDDDDPLAKYVCQNCGRGDDEEAMLLCDGCDDSYHTFCLVPPLLEVPKGDWRCPKCVAVEVSKPTEAFGFEQAQREYSLQQFGEMADQFKSEYFNMPVHMVPIPTVEKEFWRIVSSIEEDVTVEYGADLHSMDHGSGFPTNNSINLQHGDIEYVHSNWNLNNLPVLEDSVLGHINADISGMKVPWMYVGMCFATFCWHNEDHWSYSINYLHWGESKTWYGVPGKNALEFEQTMKKVAPELFQSQPDLLHQLVTIMNPNILMKEGIPVFRTDQHAGEFVVTFPRAYHAGFNQGYNFAEAVNFAPADWLKVGRECVAHYGHLRRFCVFSHDELVCKMASEPQNLSPLLAAATYRDMLCMVDVEKRLRKVLLDWGITTAKREAFELLPDDERQCEICKTTCFLSAVTCSCTKQSLVCIRHYGDLCKCLPSKHTFHYRYTLDELPQMLQGLKTKAESYDHWLNKVRNGLILDKENPNPLTLSQMKCLMNEAQKNRYPKSELMPALVSTIDDAEKCAGVIRQLETAIRRTRTRNSNERKYDLTFEELQLLIEEIGALTCVIDEIKFVKNLLAESCQFEANAKLLLTASLVTVTFEEVQDCINHGDAICIELPSLCALHIRLAQTKWLSEVSTMHDKDNRVALDEVTGLLHRGEALNPDIYIENHLTELRRLISENLDWESRARTLLTLPKSLVTIHEIADLLVEAEDVDTCLPTETTLRGITKDVTDWKASLQKINISEYYPYLGTIQSLHDTGAALQVPVPELKELAVYMNSGTAWLENSMRIFLRKNTVLSLMEVMCPRTPLALLAALKCKTKPAEDDPYLFKIPNDMDPTTLVTNFKLAESRELEGLRSLRVTNMAKSFNPSEGFKFCICQRSVAGVMMQCELCKDWFHASCVNLPKIARYKVRKNFTAVALRLGFKDCKFVCPICQRTKRPRLEIILSLLVSLQKLSVRIPEGEALQCLTERAMSWQDNVKSLLKSEELERGNGKLNILMERIHGTVQPKITESITPEASCSNSSDVPFTEPISEMNSEDSNSSLNSTVVSSSTAGDDALDEHAYSLHFPTFNSNESVLNLSEQARLQLEDTLLEGDLLEIALDETHQLWKLLQASRSPGRDVILKDFSGFKTKARKLKRKRNEPASVKGRMLAQRVAKRKRTTTTRKRNICGKSRTKRRAPSKTADVDCCASEHCVKPAAEELDWVQCDGGCDKWFHMVCVGLSAQEISEDEDYICILCSQTTSAFRGLQPPHELLYPASSSSSNPTSSTHKDM